MVLSDTWFMEGYIDFELQKYRLLAYLSEVQHCFSEKRLYPQLADLVYHYNNLLSFRANKQFLRNNFPQRIEGLNIQKMEIVYEKMLADDHLMQELEEITQFAVNQLNVSIKEGADIYEQIEHKMHLEPVGIVPLYKNEGYVFFHYSNSSEVRIYNYSITLFDHKDAKYRGIKMEYVDSGQKSLINTYEQIKIEMVRKFRELPNPAVYRVDFPYLIPLNETLLPIAKRALVKMIAE